MPVSVDQIFRDAADRRITWEEALQMTVLIDENGKVRQPANDLEKRLLDAKVNALRPYVKMLDDPFLTKIAKNFYN